MFFRNEIVSEYTVVKIEKPGIHISFGNDIIPKLIHFGFALLTAWLIFGYLRRRLNTVYALLGVVFFLSLPIIVKLSITVYVDLGLIFFSTASLLLLLKWIETDFKLRFLLLSGGLCGLAIGTKYVGLITFFLLTLFVPFLYSRYSQNNGGGFIKAVTYGILFFAAALLVFSPWMIRNYHWKSNPVYPLYNSWFNPPSPPSKEIVSNQAEKKGGLGLFTYRTIVHGEPWWQVALLPIRIFFEGKDGSDQYFDGKLNPFLLILPIFAFFRVREGPKALDREKKIFLAFAVLFFAFAFFSNVIRIRYLAPIIPPLVILAVLGVSRIADVVRGVPVLDNRYLRITTAALAVVLALGLNAHYIVSQFRYVDPFSYIGGNLTRHEYISKYCPEYPAMQYVNEHLPADAMCLFFFLGKRGYYLERNYIPDTTHQVVKFYKLVKGSDHPREVWAELTKMGISHLIIHMGFFERWVKDVFEAKEHGLLNDFFRDYVNPLYRKNGVEVLRLRKNFPAKNSFEQKM